MRWSNGALASQRDEAIPIPDGQRARVSVPPEAAFKHPRCPRIVVLLGGAFGGGDFHFVIVKERVRL